MGVSWFGVGVVLLNIILTFFVSNMRRINAARGAGISGWVSALIGVLILVYNQTSIASGLSATIALVMGIISIFAILSIIAPALSPHLNIGLFRHVSKTARIGGWFIGYIVGIIVGVLV
jgi:membrane associated rhomboid family serine protease